MSFCKYRFDERCELDGFPCASTAECRNAWDAPDTNVVKTNADHIRSMSDEELADLLHDYYCEGHTDGLHHIYDAMPISGIREWLKQPYKEDT